MLFGFFDLFFELYLPFFSTFLIIAVFLELSSSSIPDMQISVSPLCRVSGVRLHLLPCSAEISRKLRVLL